MKKGGIHVACKRWTKGGASGIRIVERVGQASGGSRRTIQRVVVASKYIHFCFLILFFSFFLWNWKLSLTIYRSTRSQYLPGYNRVRVSFCRSVIHWKLNATKSRPKKAYCMHSFEIYALSRDLIKLISTTTENGYIRIYIYVQYISSTRNLIDFRLILRKIIIVIIMIIKMIKERRNFKKRKETE